MYDKSLGEFDWGALFSSAVQGVVAVKTAQSNTALQSKQLELAQAQAAAAARANSSFNFTNPFAAPMTSVPSGYTTTMPVLGPRNQPGATVQYDASGRAIVVPAQASGMSGMTVPLLIGGAALLGLFLIMRRR